MTVTGNNWDRILADYFGSEDFKELDRFVTHEYKTATIYPESRDIFNALKASDFENTRVVILGQDPYHGKGQAHGLSFSVRHGVKTPPSLQNIYKEIRNEYGYDIPSHGNLEEWAEQGILLLNTTLTVRAGQPMSHAGHGWETMTDLIIKRLSDDMRPKVFILWGNHARQKRYLITNPRHLILESPHPSPFSAGNGFFGNGHFKKANDFLIKNGGQPINWQISET